MRSPELSLLRQAVRDEIANAFASIGFARPRDIAHLVCGANPQAITLIGNRLAEDALTDMARRELKSSTNDNEAQLQLMLPGVPEVMLNLLPPAISIPSEGSDDSDDVIYKPLDQVSFGELAAHIDLLSVQINADIRRHRALSELHDMALAYGATAQSRVFAVIASAHDVQAEVAA